MQDNIIKNVEIINFLEDTVINDPDLINSQSPRLKYSQKKVHKSAIWFLISGGGVVEKKINETTKVSISILSEGSLFGEEILFCKNHINTTQENEEINQLSDIQSDE